jgi:acyl-CoA synthetase (NDP forming)
VEIMVGARMDPQFGGLIVVGMGGTLVELLKDTAVEQAPVTRGEAFEMIDSLRGSTLLRGFRGSEPIDLEALVDIVCRFSELVSDQGDLLSELDVNPLICSGQRITAVDALIVRKAN